MDDLDRRGVTATVERRFQRGEGTSGSEGADDRPLSDDGVTGKAAGIFVLLEIEASMGSVGLRVKTTLKLLGRLVTADAFEGEGAMSSTC